MNVVVIVSDTFRRDNLSCYSSKGVYTPHLDRFAKQCVIFDQAYCASFPTVPMRADLMTGKYTFTYLGWAPLPRGEIVLPQILTNAGYTTMGIVDTPFFMRGGYNYDRGFQDFIQYRGQDKSTEGYGYSNVAYERRYEEDYFAPKTCIAAEHWLERHYKENFFLYVDTWDPHEPWDPPAHYVERYEPDWDGKLVPPPYQRLKDSSVTKKELNAAYACYCGEATMVDHAVGHLIDRIESIGLMDDTVIIFTADHGFYFGEHDIFGKSVMEREKLFKNGPLYREVNQIPLLIYVPGVKPRHTNALVSVPDFMPTILELANAKVPDTVQGKSFSSVIKEKEDTNQKFVVSTMQLQNPGEVTRAVDGVEREVEIYLPATITTDRWSLLYSRKDASVELYDIKADPAQQKNIAEDNRPVVKELHKCYYEFLKKIGTEERLLKPRASL